MKKISTSESVSLGHPDSTCDGIVAYLTDRYLQEDPNSRVALECQFKDEYVTVSGEVTTKACFSKKDICEMIRAAVRMVGYTKEYQRKFGPNCVKCDDDLEITLHISQQSPDIAQGVTGENAGWGDQGIYWGMATPYSQYGYMPKDYWLARELAKTLYNEVKEFDSIIPNCGLDIKTQVTLSNGDPQHIVVAIPTTRGYEKDSLDCVEKMVSNFLAAKCPFGDKEPYVCGYTINGTGAYSVHSSVGDCGTTGRKLAVNFYGGNCRIGGGAVFGKDPSKSDVTLNCYARYLALDFLKRNNLNEEVYCSIAGCIGKPEIDISIYDSSNKVLDCWSESKHPSDIIGMLDLRKPIWFDRCMNGLFGNSNN